MDIIFILTEPAVPENIGAAARAIKTMGFSELRLVNTKAHLKKEAKWLAHGSNDILEKASVYTNLHDSLHDIDFKIATTAKKRSVKFDYYTPEQANSIIESKNSSIKKIAIIFGREESGLTNEELSLCDIAVTIPLKTPYPSINLAQSVMIMAYTLSNCELKTNKSDNNTNNYVFLKQKTEELLGFIGINKDENLYGRVMERLSLTKNEDINVLLSVIGRLNKKI